MAPVPLSCDPVPLSCGLDSDLSRGRHRFPRAGAPPTAAIVSGRWSLVAGRRQLPLAAAVDSQSLVAGRSYPGADTVRCRPLRHYTNRLAASWTHVITGRHRRPEPKPSAHHALPRMIEMMPQTTVLAAGTTNTYQSLLSLETLTVTEYCRYGPGNVFQTSQYNYSQN